MKPDQMLPVLEAIAAALDVQVRYESLGQSGTNSPGGLCKVRGQHWLLIDKKSTPSERVAMLVDALASFDTDAVTLPEKIPDKVREALALRRQSKLPTASAASPT